MASTFQFPYREARDGFWGEQTSTLNWCEEDYNISHYCAEVVNSLTNFVFIYLGVKGIRNCLIYSHPRIFILSYIGYIVVGLGSMAFHTTLKYSMQLADELPMIYTTCILAFATFSYSKSRLVSLVIALSLVALASWITAYYLYAKDPVFHQVAYASLTATTIFRGMYVMERQLRPALKKRNPEHCDQIMTEMWKLAGTGITSFLFGFFIWNLDNIFCGQLRLWRNTILLPWAAVLEGHAWWHIFTGIGAYYFIIWRVWLHRCLDGSEKDFMLRWPSVFTSVPDVVPRSKVAPVKKSQ